MFRSFCIAAAFAALSSFSAHSQEIYKLENHALNAAYFVPNAKQDRLYAKLIVHAGEAQNPYAEGLAHYVEHLAWLNAFGREHGSFSDHANASTDHEFTIYTISSERNDVAETFDKIARIFTPFELDLAFMESERNVILREYDYRLKENTLLPAIEMLDEALYSGTVFARSVIGTPEEIATFSIEDARKLHEQSHTFANATLILMGPHSKAEMNSWVSSHFPPPKIGSGPVRPDLFFEDGRGVQSIRLDDYEQRVLIYQKYVPNTLTDKFSDMDRQQQVLDDILESTRKGSLVGPLRYDSFAARGINIGFNQPRLGQVELSISATPDEGVSLATLLSEVETTLEKIAMDGIPKKTFDRIKKRVLDGYEAKVDKASYVYRKAQYFVRIEEEPLSYDEFVASLERVTLEQVNAQIKQFLEPGRVEALLINGDE